MAGLRGIAHVLFMTILFSVHVFSQACTPATCARPVNLYSSITYDGPGQSPCLYSTVCTPIEPPYLSQLNGNLQSLQILASGILCTFYRFGDCTGATLTEAYNNPSIGGPADDSSFDAVGAEAAFMMCSGGPLTPIPPNNPCLECPTNNCAPGEDSVINFVTVTSEGILTRLNVCNEIGTCQLVSIGNIVEALRYPHADTCGFYSDSSCSGNALGTVTRGVPVPDEVIDLLQSGIFIQCAGAVDPDPCTVVTSTTSSSSTTEASTTTDLSSTTEPPSTTDSLTSTDLASTTDLETSSTQSSAVTTAENSVITAVEPSNPLNALAYLYYEVPA